MRNIFIWDIHGCYDEFLKLIVKLKITDSDKIYLVGDMINKWPKSIEVLEFLYANQRNFFAIKWNHETWFLEYMDWESPGYENPGSITLKNHCEKNLHLLDFLRNLPCYREEENFLVVHAWIIPWISIENQDLKVMTEMYFYKELPWYFSYPQDWKLLIYGHWSGNGLSIRENTIGLDSGCVKWGKLSAYILEDETIIQVQAERVFPPINESCYKTTLEKKGIYI
jgi:serine/threonine protein phosphatase 1